MAAKAFLAVSAAALLIATSALAGVSKFNGTYKGKTSQGLPITITVKAPGKYYDVTVKPRLRYKCASSRAQTLNDMAQVKITSTGRFSGVVAGGDRGFELTVSGSIRGRQASGRLSSSLYAHASATGALSDKCATGKVSFTATR